MAYTSSFYPKKTIPLVLIYLLLVLSISCKEKHLSKEEKLKKVDKEQKEIPVQSPEQSMDKMEIEDGFEVKLVASEPLISSPIAMAFDDSMRLWVVEMRSFKPITGDASEEELPQGRISILEDTNGDGVMDSSKVFLDSLDVARAIYLDNEGILVATPPNLWYVERNKDDEPGEKTLVDSSYTATKNTEGQTNGLYRSLDNWIYSTGFGSDTRYRKVDGEWHKKPTPLRGQWGATQDNLGRLFYNNNSTQLLGDYLMPGLVDTNKFQGEVAGYNELIVDDQKVYPAGPTPDINNPLREAEDNLKLKKFTAAGSPIIYRESLFGSDYAYNAFVAEPAGHLIKRNILQKEGNKIKGEQAYQDKEFLASTDKRFRPVSLYNGPEGALYVVDMYRGVIQDSMWVSPHLRQYSLNHAMDQPINTGRIYKIIPSDQEPTADPISDRANELVEMLRSDNGWIRDRAQKKLVEEGYKQTIPKLRDILRKEENKLFTKVHSLWALEGLHGIEEQDLTYLLDCDDKRMRKQAINVLGAVLNERNYKAYMPMLKDIISRKDSATAPNTAYLINRFQEYDPKAARKFTKNLLTTFPENKLVADALINGLEDEKQEKEYLEMSPDSAEIFKEHLSEVLEERATKDESKDAKEIYHAGFDIYESICMSCHGVDGAGIKGSGLPLNQSEWVEGDKDKLIAIILKGLGGSIKVHGETYKKSEGSDVMPSFEDELSDKQATALVNYIRHAWDNDGSSINLNDISIIRQKFIDRNEPFTADELNEIFSND